ncbi:MULTISPECIES: hypothetical protein [Bradyrhizobium]|uniref:hypothetical protein n=1 Tax=Bradyrhizobium TaxID=374 RepID=UPI001F2C5B00|nr:MULTISPECIES: hypothetical protein [Bradyrhizobium]
MKHDIQFVAAFIAAPLAHMQRLLQISGKMDNEIFSARNLLSLELDLSFRAAMAAGKPLTMQEPCLPTCLQ